MLCCAGAEAGARAVAAIAQPIMIRWIDVGTLAMGKNWTDSRACLLVVHVAFRLEIVFATYECAMASLWIVSS